jgi:hypothetical protein
MNSSWLTSWRFEPVHPVRQRARPPRRGRKLVSLADFLEYAAQELDVVLSYDLGNGPSIERGGDIVDKWQGAGPRMARAAGGRAVDRYLRYLNLRARHSEDPERRGHRAQRGCIVPADGAGFEHGSITSILRAWSCDSRSSTCPSPAC